ncbi:MAG: twin-arginine translocation signal domain-containing protein, partial [Verrucomicrobia bacterium]|nr:twin-arginine translocation signal domain-containing protein [Verrucomicrobiota bacterium]
MTNVSDNRIMKDNPSPMKKSTDRRGFIQKAGTLAAGAVVAGETGLWAPRVQSQEKKKLGYALVGLGGLSTNQIAPGLEKTEYSRLAGIVSGTPSKIEKWKAKYKLPARSCYNYDNFDQIA